MKLSVRRFIPTDAMYILHRNKSLVMWITVLSAIATVAVLLSGSLAQQPQRDPKGRGDGPQVLPNIGIRPLVEPGDPGKAEAYYKRIAKELEFPDAEKIMEQRMQVLLDYCGYKEPTADNVELLSPEDLMKLSQTPNEILAMRFFAPKITDVSPAGGPVSYGWRKLIRFLPRKGSTAEKKGITGLFLLFNVFQQDLTKDPFSVRSKNNQAILVRGKPSGSDPVYWLVYGELPEGKILTFLTASFDARDPTQLPPEGRYYVPHACADCHGGLNLEREPQFDRGKLNYLDSDHWFDRVQLIPEKDDFVALRDSKHGVVFDGGKVTADGGTEPTSDRFKNAFEVIRKLNQEVCDQNASLPDQKEKTFQLRAVQTWLALHEKNEQYVQPLDRPLIQANPGDPQWDKTSKVDSELLPKLNRYCFRCHSSVKYHVFDKKMVLDRKSLMQALIQFGPTGPDGIPIPFMPQDRRLSDDTKATLVRLLGELK